MTSNTCFFCKREFDKHNKDDALFCIAKIIGGKG